MEGRDVGRGRGSQVEGISPKVIRAGRLRGTEWNLSAMGME